MNKKLVAVAIAGVLAAPLAQAQTANVTLYGRPNMNMAFVNGGKFDAASGNTNPTIFRVDSNSSRFGIRGTESLGGGLNAIFQIENGSINMSSTGGVLAGRDTFLGLSGSWGTFKMGFFSAPYDDITIIQGSSTLNTGILSTGSLWAQATQDPSGTSRAPSPPAVVSTPGWRTRFATIRRPGRDSRFRGNSLLPKGARPQEARARPPARTTIPAVAIPATATARATS